MYLHQVSRIVLCVMVAAVASSMVIAHPVAADPDPFFTEMVMIHADCSNASVTTLLSVSSDNPLLVHFPYLVWKYGEEYLENATLVSVMTSANRSVLTYEFENISEAEAEMNADAVTVWIDSYFGVSFTYESTWSNNSIVHVSYAGDGQSCMPCFVNAILSDCVDESVDGFSDAIPSLAAKTTTSYFGFSAVKENEGNWTIGVAAVCNSTILPGSNSHTIDVLALLGVSSLAPSLYSYNVTADYYESIVWLNLECDPPVTFVSCDPPEKQNFTDPSERGWFDMWSFYGFSFGNDSSPVETLTFTFSGTVIPEFEPSTIIITIMSITASLITFKWQMKRRIHQ